MAQTLVDLLAQIVFSTKDRRALITPEVEPELFAYIGGILRNHNSRLLNANGTSDHLHLLVSQSKNVALSTLMKDVKKDSSRWIKTQSRSFRDFQWQDGYGAFSFGRTDLPSLNRYLANQKEHHRKRSFKEELIELLDRHRIDYDERYLWI